jgi:hypothetical protein
MHVESPEAVAESLQHPVRNAGRDASCVKNLLKKHSQQVYHFRANDHDAEIDGHSSFASLVTAWEDGGKKYSDSDSIHYPEVRSGKGSKVYTSCTVRCTCTKCTEGEPVELVCESYPFGTARGMRPQVNTCPRTATMNAAKICMTKHDTDSCAQTSERS